MASRRRRYKVDNQLLDDEYVSIPVPKRYVTQVYGFIASLVQQNAVTASPTPRVVEMTPVPAAYYGWTEDLIRRQYKESQDTMRKFQKVLAEHPDHEYSSDELAEAIGLERGWNSIAGALGAYKRRLRNRYGREQWPFAISYDANGHSYFSMSPEVAEIIRPLS